MQLKCFFFLIYLPNIKHHMRNLVYIELQCKQLLLRCDIERVQYRAENVLLATDVGTPVV